MGRVLIQRFVHTQKNIYFQKKRQQIIDELRLI